MLRKLEISCVYLTGLFQGLVLVTVPAASLVFTSAGKFDFSSSEYGLLFVPQVIMAIAASLSGAALARRWGMKTVFRSGLICNIAAMALIASSQWVSHNHHAAYTLVILGTALVGAGFGSTLPTINVYAGDFFPGNSASALTVLHTLLGLGTALAPFLVTVLIKTGWWLLPVWVMGILSVLLAATFALPLKGQRQGPMEASGDGNCAFVPVRVRLFMLIVFLYGFCETIFANWAIIFLNKEKDVPGPHAGYALAAFWVMVSAGRLLISVLSLWVPPRLIYRTLPLLIMASLWAVTLTASAAQGIFLFGMAGLSCSGFFPLTFSLGQKGFESMAEKVAGWIMASYMLGYGMAAYAVGEIIGLTHASLASWYLGSTVIALGVLLLSFILT